MKNLESFIKRNIIWILGIIVAAILLNPAIQELKTILIIIITELIAIALSSLATIIYTELDFTDINNTNLGFIFLGVHLCVGLTILGSYIVQF